MQELVVWWQERYANYLESAVDDGDPVRLTYAQWFSFWRDILEYPRRREYIWLVPEPDKNGDGQ